VRHTGFVSTNLGFTFWGAPSVSLYGETGFSAVLTLVSGGLTFFGSTNPIAGEIGIPLKQEGALHTLFFSGGGTTFISGEISPEKGEHYGLSQEAEL